jgi:antitoxin CptB
MFGKSVGDLRARRKQLLYRASHRGTREMDIILGSFAGNLIDALTMEDLDRFEAILQEADRDLLAWFTGEDALPERMRMPLFYRILAHQRQASRGS